MHQFIAHVVVGHRHSQAVGLLRQNGALDQHLSGPLH